MRCSTHRAAATAVGLLIALPLDAAPRRLVPVPQPRPAIRDARSSVPQVSASQNQDRKQANRTDDAARDDEACLARFRALDVRFDIPIMPVASRASCTIEVPVASSRSRPTRGRWPRSVCPKSPSCHANLARG